MTKFNEMFREPMRFWDGELALSREDYSKEQAYEIFKKEGFEGEINDIQEDWVKYRGDQYEGEWKMGWWAGSEGQKGAKKIWIIN